MSDYRWGANGHKQHLFPSPYVCVISLCESGYSGDNPAYSSKRKKCKICEKLENARKKKDIG